MNPNCEKGYTLDKEKCTCTLQNPIHIGKTLEKISVKAFSKLSPAKRARLRKRARLGRTTAKKKQCPQKSRRNKKTGICESNKFTAKRRSSRTANQRRAQKKPLVASIQKTPKFTRKKSTQKITSIPKTKLSHIDEKALKTLKRSFSPSINKRLQSLKKISPDSDIFSCPKKREIAVITKTGKHKCFHWKSKQARDIMLRNISSSKITSSNVVAPKQIKSNCWFNTFFMCIFISDKGRKFFRHMRECMVLGQNMQGEPLPKKLLWVFFLLNKSIDASLIGKKDITNFAYLMDTNIMIRNIAKNDPQKIFEKTRKSWSPIQAYNSIFRILSGLKNNQFQLAELAITKFNSLHNVSKLQFDSTKGKRGSRLPDVLVFQKNELVKVDILERISINTTKYKLDSVILRNNPTKNEDGWHFSSYITCNKQDYAFEGSSHERLRKFKWRKKLNKQKDWQFEDTQDEFWNFQKGAAFLFYYRI